MLLVRDECKAAVLYQMKKNAPQSNSRTLLPAVLCRTVFSEVVKLHVCLDWFFGCRGSWVTMGCGGVGRLLVWLVRAVSRAWSQHSGICGGIPKMRRRCQERLVYLENPLSIWRF